MPTISVVVPTRGRARFLHLALGSALRQREVDLEIVLVDDGSPEEVHPRLRGLDDERIRVVSHEHPQGVSAARNTGISASQGEWVAFLDDDDLWSPEKLSQQLSAAGSSGRRWVYTGAVTIDADDRVLHVEPVLEPALLLERLPRQNVVPTSNVLVHRETLRAAGQFDPRLRLTEDWDLYLRLARREMPAFVPQHLVAFRTHPDQSSLDTSGFLAELDEFERRHRVRVDRVAILRGAAWSCLRAGHRRAALEMYRKAIGRGDVSSVARMAVALLPDRLRGRILDGAAAKNGDDLSEAQRWVDDAVRPSS
jgi:glycosyltransferase involved in cell wall biosynthesis